MFHRLSFFLVTLALYALGPTPLALQSQDAPQEGEPPAAEPPELVITPIELEVALDVPIEVLDAQLRPMRKAEVEEQLNLWLELLKAKSVEVRDVVIATLNTEDAEELTRLSDHGVHLRAERQDLIDRVKVAIEIFEAKGGDATEATAYIDSVVVAPPVTGFRAAWAALLAWLTNPDGGLAMLINLGVVVLIVVASWIGSGLLARLVDRALKRFRRISELLRKFIRASVRNVTLFLGILVALSRLGFDMGPLMAAIGAAGLVVGLALQGTLSNFASGIMIMIYRPFDMGDVVSAAGVTGTIEGLSLVTTTLKTFDNQVIYIPNNKIWGDVITNVTASRTRRVDLVFGVGYEDDLRKTKEILMGVLEKHEKVLADPKPVVQVHELADSSVNFVVRPWVRTDDYWDVYWDLTQTVKERFDAEGISIPFPQRDVHFYPQAAQNGEGSGWLQPADPRAQTGEPAPAGETAGEAAAQES